MTIQPLTPEALRAAAREAAEQDIPHAEANHHEPGSVLWHEFFDAYRAHRAAMAWRDINTPAMRRMILRNDIRSIV